VAPIEWRDHKINVLDAPGYADFMGEVKCAMRVVDASVILLDASAGVEVGTEYAWQFSQERSLPCIVVVNKMDRENADFGASLKSAQSILGNKITPLFIPIGSESSFRGVIDLLRMKALTFSAQKDGDDSAGDVPPEMLDEAETYRLELVEKIAENDEDLMLRYLEDEELAPEELADALRSAIAAGEIVPVLASASTTNRGIAILLDALVAYAPAPHAVIAHGLDGSEVTLSPTAGEPAAALVWKTIADPFVGKLTYFRTFSGTIRSDSHLWNTSRDKDERLGQLYVMRGKEQIPVTEIGPGDIGAVAKLIETSTCDTLADPARKVTLGGVDLPRTLFTAAVSPRTKSDLDKMGAALARLIDEDPTIHIGRDPQTGETIVSGLGESHVQIALERVARKFGVNVDIGLPSVPYRETIQRAVQHVEY
jgi:elongation factor G